jgi:hypothetical protein
MRALLGTRMPPASASASPSTRKSSIFVHRCCSILFRLRKYDALYLRRSRETPPNSGVPRINRVSFCPCNLMEGTPVLLCLSCLSCSIPNTITLHNATFLQPFSTLLHHGSLFIDQKLPFILSTCNLGISYLEICRRI